MKLIMRELPFKLFVYEYIYIYIYDMRNYSEEIDVLCFAKKLFKTRLDVACWLVDW